MPIHPKNTFVSWVHHPSKALVALGVSHVSLVVDKLLSAEALLDGQEPCQTFLVVPRG